MRLVVALVALTAVGCGGGGGSPTRDASSPSDGTSPPVIATPGASATQLVFHAGDSGAVEFGGGDYIVSWEAPGCSFLTLDATVGDDIVVEVPTTLPSGEATVTILAGSGYLNRAADCEYTVALRQAP
jgi:hypothetical protein